MITLSNGHSFEYMAASGAFAFDGKGWPWEYPLRKLGFINPRLFTCVIKTLTRHPRKGNLKLYKPWTCVRLLRGGTVNAVGLTNPGIEWWCKKIGPNINAEKMPLIGNIYAESTEELAEMAAMVNPFDLVGLEINASCPNTKGDILSNTQKIIDGCRAVKRVSRFPLILKVSVVHDVKTTLVQLEGCIEAVSINSVPWSVAFPDVHSPLEHLGGGGVSGRAAQNHTWKLVERIASFSSLPVIGPSIWNFEDLEALRTRGARALSFGSVFIPFPWRPTQFVKRDIALHS